MAQEAKPLLLIGGELFVMVAGAPDTDKAQQYQQHRQQRGLCKYSTHHYHTQSLAVS